MLRLHPHHSDRLTHCMISSTICAWQQAAMMLELQDFDSGGPMAARPPATSIHSAPQAPEDRASTGSQEAIFRAKLSLSASREPPTVIYCRTQNRKSVSKPIAVDRSRHLYGNKVEKSAPGLPCWGLADLRSLVPDSEWPT